MRRLLALTLPVLLLATLIPASSVAATPAQVTGTLVSKDKAALGPGAVAVISIVDQQASPDAGAVVGSQRVDNAQLPLSFAVQYDTAAVDPTHSYAMYASVTDGSRTLQSLEPVPVITGGPTSGVTVLLVPLSSAETSTVPGTITRTDKSALTPSAVAYAALINQATGTMISRQAIPSPGSGPIPFAIPFDPGVIDDTVTYVIRAGIVDGTKSWTSTALVPAIVNGAVVSGIAVPVVPAAGPTPTATPTPKPTATPKPTPKPTASPKPTPKPTSSPTPKPTATPTQTPTATPAPTATPSPSLTPSPTPSPSPTASPSPSPSPSPTASPSPTPTAMPDTGIIRGTLTYREDHGLTPAARAVVILVEGNGGPHEGDIVASTSIRDPGPQPVPFELAYPMSAVSAGTPYFLYAGIADGDLAWVTPVGVSVKVPWPVTENVELPLAFRPDLLKGAVTGTISGAVDATRDPSAYATAFIIRSDTGETVGFQLITPVGSVPIPFSVPYDPSKIDQKAEYRARAEVWDGTALWTSATGTPVITAGNPKSGVDLVVKPPEPTPTPTPTPTVPPTPSATAAPVQPPAGDGGGGLVPILVIAALAVLGVGGFVAYRRSRTVA